ncbi:hypothetical protein OBRU01_23914 [Operophtera brumata]|uniref:CRAL-TRIO domain-containing protein n=1 Tax=Operophtera brumata TaxID=104452 RepID=A0A0L7KMX3_OPEBR|nr:hypothetical protein OBRU01_23914 [Operophtera brumata]
MFTHDFPSDWGSLDDKLVVRFLHSNYYNLEKAKSTAELFFSLRAAAPELLTNRDPRSPNLQKVLKIINLAHYTTADNRNLWIWQLNDPGMEAYDYLEDARLFFLSTDAWLLQNDNLQAEDIVILDVKDISLRFLTKFNVSIAKKLSKYQEAIHIVNSPPIIDKLYAIMKPFMKQDMTSMVSALYLPNSPPIIDKLNAIMKQDMTSMVSALYLPNSPPIIDKL